MNKKQQLSELFKSFEQHKIIIAGDVMQDAYIYGDVNRISPEAPVPVVSVIKNDYRLGGAGNVAVNIKALGATPLLVSITGSDSTGENVLSMLDENSISKEYIIKDDARKTTCKTRIISKGNQLLRLDDEGTDDINLRLQNQLLEKIKFAIENEKPSALIFEDYNKGVLTEKIIREVTLWCLDKNIPVAVDPKQKNFFAYQLCTLFKPNLREIKESMHVETHHTDEKTLHQIAEDLYKKLHHGITLITLGDKGIYLHSGKETIQKNAHLRNVADVSGAGDTVISMAALCLAAKTSLETLAGLSNLAGGLVCEYAGVVPVNKERLLVEAIEFL